MTKPVVSDFFFILTGGVVKKTGSVSIFRARTYVITEIE